nr:hypothetical protein [Methanobrevibacter arboriphilus]
MEKLTHTHELKKFEKTWSKKDIKKMKNQIKKGIWLELDFFRNNLKKGFGEITLKGVGYNSKSINYTKIIALREINLALYCLKLFIPQNYSFGVKGESYIGISRGYYIYDPNKPILQNSEILDNTIRFDLNEEMIKSLEESGFNTLNQILLKKKNQSMSQGF